jgi:hypothetical protein
MMEKLRVIVTVALVFVVIWAYTETVERWGRKAAPATERSNPARP